MKANGSVYVSKEAIYVECELSEAARLSAAQMMFHPALIDGSAVCSEEAALCWFDKKLDSKLSLPLYFESFRTVELLKRACIARVTRESIRNMHEVKYCNLEFFNDSGRKIAELRSLAGKTVRDIGAIDLKIDSIQSTGESTEMKQMLPVNPRPLAGTSKPVSLEGGSMEQLLRELIARRLNRRLEDIDERAEYHELGLKSADMLDVAREVGTKLNLRISPTLLFEYVTISKTSEQLIKSYEREARTETAMTNANVDDLLEIDYTFEESDELLQDHLVLNVPALMGVTHPCLVLESYLQHPASTLPLELTNVRFHGGPITLKREREPLCAQACQRAKTELLFVWTTAQRQMEE
jgi:polyketide synthase PksN